MDKLPLSLYDIIGYLASGVLLMATWAVVFLPQDSGTVELSASWSVVILLLAYILGQAISTVGDWLIGIPTRLLLKNPQEWILGERKPLKWLTRTDYFKVMEADPLARLEQKIAKNTGMLSTEALRELRKKDKELKALSYAKFLHCYYSMIMVQSARERLYTFLALYGFCRNASITLVAAAALLSYGERSLGKDVLWGRVDTSFVIAVAWTCAGLLFFRYLKFYRHYVTQVFMLYLEESGEPTESKK